MVDGERLRPVFTIQANSSGTTRLKMWVKRSIERLLIVTLTVLNAHIFKRVEPVGWAPPTT